MGKNRLTVSYSIKYDDEYDPEETHFDNTHLKTFYDSEHYNKEQFKEYCESLGENFKDYEDLFDLAIKHEYEVIGVSFEEGILLRKNNQIVEISRGFKDLLEGKIDTFEMKGGGVMDVEEVLRYLDVMPPHLMAYGGMIKFVEG